VHRRSILSLTVLTALYLTAAASAQEPSAGDSTAVPDSVFWKPSPTGAAFRSALLPGWGQTYVDSPIKAAIYGGIEFGLVIAVYRQHRRYEQFQHLGQERQAEVYRDNRNRMSWYLTAAVILSMMDAFVDAHLYDFDVSEDFAATPAPQPSATIDGLRVNFCWRFE